MSKTPESIENLMRMVEAPSACWRASLRELWPGGAEVPATDRALRVTMQWLTRAQDCSKSKDGGVARDFSLKRGWNTSYPETTGYIAPTFLQYADAYQAPAFRARAQRMLDWLADIQFEDGSYQGGRIDSEPAVPVVFNTGQILLGLAAGSVAIGEPFTTSAWKAGHWLVSVQDEDGAWRKYGSPFAREGLKTYDAHVAWGLFAAGHVLDDRRLTHSGIANIDWVLGQQTESGWFTHNCLSDTQRPLTHTIGYALRGIVEAYGYTGHTRFLNAAQACADALLAQLGPDGFLAGRYDAKWEKMASWSCLTGSAQIACCWLRLYTLTGRTDYLEAGRLVNRYLRARIEIGGDENLVGAVKGSDPIYGGYCPFEYPNWASKFLADSLMYEMALNASSSSEVDDDADLKC